MTKRGETRNEAVCDGDLTQLGRHRRGRRLSRCYLIDCITVFHLGFEKSCSTLVEFTRSRHSFCTIFGLFSSAYFDDF